MKEPLLLVLKDKIYFFPAMVAKQLDEAEKDDDLLLFRLASFVLCADTGRVLKNRHSLEDVFRFYLSNT